MQAEPTIPAVSRVFSRGSLRREARITDVIIPRY